MLIIVLYFNFYYFFIVSLLADVFCWISNGKALLVVLGVPVLIILLFNGVALTFTMISIWKIQKVFLGFYFK